MRISLVTPALLLVALGMAACGEERTNPPPPVSILAHDTPRCYELRRTKSLYYAPPQLRLETTPTSGSMRGQGRDSAWQLTRLNARGRAIVDGGSNAFLYWTAASPDSISIVISTGRSGSRLIVGAGKGDALQGRAVEFWDLGPSENDGGAVTLVRIPCVGPG